MNINPMDFIKNIQEAQGKMGEIQGKLKGITVQGSSGGGLVTVTINGIFQITGIQIDPLAVDPRDVKMLEELIVSASSAAFVKINEKIKEEMSQMSGMAMPPGFLGME